MNEAGLRAYILELEQALMEAVLHEESLTEGLETRSVIGQAMGILMERHALTSEEAFGLLRDPSQHHNIKLREIARSVVAERDEDAQVIDLDREATAI